MGCVLVTGSNSGIGLETALRFAREGSVVVAGMRTLEKGGELRERAEGLAVHLARLDVTDAGSIGACVEGALRDHGGIEVLVNNAGIGAIGALEDTPETVARQVFEVNVFGLVAVTRAVLPAMRRAGRGVVINVGSMQGLVPVPFFSIYGATKAAVEGLTESLHYEIEPFGLRAVVVEPGRFSTAFVNNLVSERADDDTYRALTRQFLTGWSAIPGRETLPPTRLVADAIYRAATDPACPRHLAVGTDIETLLRERDRLGAAGFEDHLRSVTAYPRREPAT